jgi:hypothetical protein
MLTIYFLGVSKVANVEAIEKFANKEVSFICEPLLGYEVQGKTFNRMGFILIQRGQDNSAKMTNRYYFDFSAIKLLAYEVIEQGKKPDFSEYKTVGDKSRTISIKVTDKGQVAVTIGNGSKGQKDIPKLWIPLTPFNFKRLMLSCLDYVRNFELAQHISGEAYKEREYNGGQKGTPESGWGGQYQDGGKPPTGDTPPENPPWDGNPQDEPPF